MTAVSSTTSCMICAVTTEPMGRSFALTRAGRPLFGIGAALLIAIGALGATRPALGAQSPPRPDAGLDETGASLFEALIRALATGGEESPQVRSALDALVA